MLQRLSDQKSKSKSINAFRLPCPQNQQNKFTTGIDRTTTLERKPVHHHYEYFHEKLTTLPYYKNREVVPAHDFRHNCSVHSLETVTICLESETTGFDFAYIFLFSMTLKSHSKDRTLTTLL